MSSSTHTFVAPMDPASLPTMVFDNPGKAWLLSQNLISNDDKMIGMSMDIDKWGGTFADFYVFWLGPALSLQLKTENIFSNAPAATLYLNITPFDVHFDPNTWLTQWQDGASMIARSEIRVDPPSATNDVAKLPWSFRLGIFAPTALSATVYLQIIPQPLSSIKACLWNNSTWLPGLITNIYSDVPWLHSLPDSDSHVGPTPFLRDCRLPAYKSTLPPTQSFRDAVLMALSRATRPRNTAIEFAEAMNPAATRDNPVEGELCRVIEHQAVIGAAGPSNGLKRGATSPPEVTRPAKQQSQGETQAIPDRAAPGMTFNNSSPCSNISILFTRS